MGEAPREGGGGMRPETYAALEAVKGHPITAWQAIHDAQPPGRDKRIIANAINGRRKQEAAARA